MTFVSCMACVSRVSCMACIARQTSFFLFPILIIPVLDMESPQRDPLPPTLPTTIQAGPDSTHAETDYLLLILRMDAIQISPRIAPDAPSYHLQTSPIPAGPGIAQGSTSRKALSGRTGHRIRPYYAPQSSTALRHIDMGHITPSMPYYDPPSENQKDSKMSHPLYTILPHFAIFVLKFYFDPNFTH